MKTKTKLLILLIIVFITVIGVASLSVKKEIKSHHNQGTEKELNALNLCNATDSLILLLELATESSGDYIQAKADHIEMLCEYVKHMENRYGSRTVVLENDIIKELKLAIKKLKEDESEVDQQMKACEKIKTTSEAIAEFLSKYELFRDEPIVSSKPGAVSKKMQTVIRDLLDEARKKTRTHVSDPNMVNSEAAYRANRKAIVYLYLARFEWSKIVTLEEIADLMGDINRTIYWTRVLLKRSAEINEKERSRLTNCSANELRHVRLLRAIKDNDMREAHALLRLAIMEAFPDVQFFN